MASDGVVMARHLYKKCYKYFINMICTSKNYLLDLCGLGNVESERKMDKKKVSCSTDGSCFGSQVMNFAAKKSKNGPFQSAFANLQNENGPFQSTFANLQNENGPFQSVFANLQNENGPFQSVFANLQNENGPFQSVFANLQNENGPFQFSAKMGNFWSTTSLSGRCSDEMSDFLYY